MNDMPRFSNADQQSWQAFVDGEPRAAAGGKTFAVLNPATGETIASVADCSHEDALAAIDAAQRALADWRARTAAERGTILRRWYDLMIAEEDALARLITAEMGKPLPEALGEVRYGAGYIKWFAEEAERVYGEIIPAPSAGQKPS